MESRLALHFYPRPLRISFWLVVCWLTVTVSVFAAVGGAGSASPDQVGGPQHLVMMIVYAVIALTFSFLCSVAEAVVLSVSPSYIANLKNSGHERQAALLGKIKTNIDRSLAAILTLNTIAHTVGAGGAGAEAAAYFGANYVGIAMAILTLLILFLSEIIPKTIGAVYWRSLAPITSQFVQLLIWALYPLILVSELITKFLSGGHSGHSFSRDEFTAMVDIGEAAGKIDRTESRIVSNLFRFPELCAEDIMTPRTVVFAIQQDATVDEVIKDNPQLHFSRMPVYAETRDDVTGFVLKTDLLLSQQRTGGKARLRDIKREIRGIYERTPLSKVLEDVLDNRSHIMLVVDEHGGMEGILTLEDVVETLIGIEIVDESDTIDDMRRLARRKWQERMERVGIDVRQL